MVNWQGDDVIAAALGGAILGIATSLNLKLFLRTTGMSGVFNSLIKYDHSSGFMWKYFVFLGMITVPVVCEMQGRTGMRLFGLNISFFEAGGFAAQLNWIGWLIAGVLVGLGTRMGNGCTSGHGVCGIPRLSKRSIAATIIFTLSGMAMATYRAKNSFFHGGVSGDFSSR